MVQVKQTKQESNERSENQRPFSFIVSQPKAQSEDSVPAASTNRKRVVFCDVLTACTYTKFSNKCNSTVQKEKKLDV